MIPQFQILKEEEINSLLDAPVLITALIAGSEEEINKEVIDEAISLTNLKKFRSREDLQDYYKAVAGNFHKKLEITFRNLPDDREQRNKILSDQLEKLNTIFPKVEKSFAVQLYSSLKNFAKRIAESSGGFLGYGSISEEERQYIDLHMIQDPS